MVKWHVFAHRGAVLGHLGSMTLSDKSPTLQTLRSGAWSSGSHNKRGCQPRMKTPQRRSEKRARDSRRTFKSPHTSLQQPRHVQLSNSSLEF